ncbi:MAG: hypothetical protein IIA77_11430 [Proteobacteria bacterium]|nr:hypothetical protein [Pseudomonadota bacterium]
MLITQNKGQFLSYLFPNKPRDLPFRRTIRISFRTLHILAAGVLLGGHIFNQPIAILEPWLWATVITGIIILLTDLHASLAVVFEVRGLAVLIKVILLLLVPVFWEQRIALLISILAIGAISSHMPKQYRHKILFFQKQVTPDQRSG